MYVCSSAEAGNLYSFGANGDGQLGQPVPDEQADLPQLVQGWPTGKKAKVVDGGSEHSLAVTGKAVLSFATANQYHQIAHRPSFYD